MKVGFDVRVSALCLLLAPTVSSTGAAETVADTKFSVNRGFYVIPFRVKISSVTPDAEIRYTTDGSEPALNHGSGGPSPQLVEVTTTTVLRAKAFREGLEPTNVDTQTYLFTNHVLEQPDEIPGYPSLVMRTSGSTSATLDYGMDPEIARDPAYRERLLDGLESINPNRKIFEARKRETAALGAGEKLVLGHPLAATIGDSARCMQNLEKVLFTGPKTSDTVTFICD